MPPSAAGDVQVRREVDRHAQGVQLLPASAAGACCSAAGPSALCSRAEGSHPIAAVNDVTLPPSSSVAISSGPLRWALIAAMRVRT